MSSNVLNESHVSGVLKSVCEAILGQEKYSGDTVADWTARITKTCTDNLGTYFPGYKFIVTCTIFPTENTGLYIDSSCRWDKEKDRLVTYAFDNSHVVAVLAAFAISTQ